MAEDCQIVPLADNPDSTKEHIPLLQKIVFKTLLVMPINTDLWLREFLQFPHQMMKVISNAFSYGVMPQNMPKHTLLWVVDMVTGKLLPFHM